MPSAHLCYLVDGGCTFHRLLQPARFCRDYFKERGWDLQVGDGFPKGHDAYFFHGLPMNGDTLAAVLMATRQGKFVWCVDDDWLTVPEWNPARPSEVQLAVYHMLKAVSDYVLVSTPHLASTFADISHKVLVAPNMIDVERFPKVQVEEYEGRQYPVLKPKLPVRVVWSGGVTHSGDLEEMTDALDELLAKYAPERCVVIYNGMQPPPRLLTKYLHRGLFHQPMTPFATYQQVLNSIDCHVYLAPQAKVPFNLSKSNIRVTEGWALGAAPVATDWGEYGCIRNGKDGRLVDNTRESWYSAIVRLVTDHECRVQMGLQGYCRVHAEYNWNRPECRAPWYKALSTIFGIPT